jgi:hypothetical protein
VKEKIYILGATLLGGPRGPLFNRRESGAKLEKNYPGAQLLRQHNDIHG